MAVPCNIRGSASQLFYQDQQCPQYQALLAITEMPHPDRSIVGAFLMDARNPQEAARYFLRETAIDGTSHSVPARTISEFLSDWKYLVSMFRPIVATGLSAETQRLVYERDGGRCCLTQTQFKSPEDSDLHFVHIVPPRVLMHPDLVEGARLFEMLYAFLSNDSMQSLRSILPLNSSMERLDNLWLLSVSAFELVEAGEYSINTNLYRYKTRSEMSIAPSAKMLLLDDKTTDKTPIPHEALFELHALFSKSLAWMETRRHMIEQRDAPSANMFRFSLLPTLLFRTIRRIWTTLPYFIRYRAYEKLHSVGLYLYGQSLSPRVQRLPFGLYLRKGRPQQAVQYRAEAHTLGMVEKFTQIPAPRAIDILETPNASYLLMTQVPGRPIGQLLNTMTDKQVENVVTDLKRYVAQLRAIPNEVSKFQICNSQGGGILDWRIPDSQSEELRFQTETDFHDYLTRIMTEDTRRHAAKSHATPHAIVFTHGDLNPRNILAENGKITGIVDWENAGFFPEYWEYTKMHYTVRSLTRWLVDVVDRVFEGYRDELHVENMLSDLSGPF
ncbi:hypothetical protein DTO013E5_1233 [Penicillium roqueforti]|nr:hypothetical protein CBS147355_113 [Penicillium roqueforti]KAI2728733.1 hypothetical protein CBS147354_1980 [Penicillium roqueforti]KAI2748155.1 hypothetical protein DTO012A1_801 [Penicillium roqueforti]KAI3170179.1 hypothetical protein DTO039G3_4408 [Penicillium roqueforti]KAI3183930.1 hypothetical protein DTO032C6_6489 [Penicillium roqueforti]